MLEVVLICIALPVSGVSISACLPAYCTSLENKHSDTHQLSESSIQMMCVCVCLYVCTLAPACVNADVWVGFWLETLE